MKPEWSPRSVAALLRGGFMAPVAPVALLALLALLALVALVALSLPATAAAAAGFFESAKSAQTTQFASVDAQQATRRPLAAAAAAAESTGNTAQAALPVPTRPSALATGSPGAETIPGRLFFSAGERQALDRLRNLDLPATAGTPARLRIDGRIRRSSGRGTVWINGRPHDAGADTASGVDGLRTGESWQASTETRHDLIGDGRIAIHAR